MQKQAICSSREENNVVEFKPWTSFTKEIQDMLNNGNIWGVYYEEDLIVAEDIWGEIHKNVIQ
ncbi:MAG: hypothetical protein AAFQ92_18115 [Bacteroidota bacterium]